MQHFWTIFEREYFNIVKKRAFWLTTLLLPLGMALVIGIQVISMMSVSTTETMVWVAGNGASPLRPNLVSGEGIQYKFTNMPLDSLKSIIELNKSDIAIQFPDSLLLTKKEISFPVYHATSSVSESVLRELKKQIKEAIYAHKRDRLGFTQTQLDKLKFNLDANTQRVTKEGNQQSSTAMAYGLGFMMNILMYMLVVMYGSIMMQSVIEEKNNRIVEIILSSVEPFKLLMGKILAVALAGLTQFLLWILLSGVVSVIAGIFMGITLNPDDLTATSVGSGINSAEQEAMARELIAGIRNFNWSILWFFPIYFLGGFLLMGSLYAALGSAVDNVQDGQQFAMPLTFISVLPMLFISNILQNPNSGFAIFTSIFPFFSPMVMMARMSLTEVPAYQIFLSIFSLVACFVLSVWVAGKIYRTGILMYGKKPSFKEMLRWLKY